MQQIHIYILCLMFMASQAHQAMGQTHGSPLSPAAIEAEWKWTKSKWTTETDTVLRARREEIDAAFSDGWPHPAIVTHYKDQWLQATHDRLKLFLYAYSVYREARNDRPRTIDYELVKALHEIQPPYSYEFLRMRYLVMITQGFQMDQLTALGERLANADPKEFDVRGYLSRAFRTDLPESRKRALAYAQELLALKPDNPTGYGSMASVYFNDWILSNGKSVSAARQAIHWANEYLKRETRPSTEKDRQMTQAIIDRLKQFLAKAEPNT